MKIGIGQQQIEGSAQEIVGLFDDQGLDFNKFFQEPEEPIRFLWVFVVGLALFGSVLIVAILEPPHRKIAFLTGLFLTICWAGIVQAKYKSVPLTSLVGVGSLIMLLAAYDVMSPAQVLEAAERMKPK